MTYLETLALIGPKTFYEKLAMSLNTDELVEFLVSEAHQKDKYIQVLETLIKQELGDDWWQMYADHIVAQGQPGQAILEFRGVEYETGNRSADIPF